MGPMKGDSVLGLLSEVSQSCRRNASDTSAFLLALDEPWDLALLFLFGEKENV